MNCYHLSCVKYNFLHHVYCVYPVGNTRIKKITWGTRAIAMPFHIIYDKMSTTVF